jgi:multisubunit Na+/H+ antiporter MnhB subunit
MISVRKSHAILWLAGIGLLVFLLMGSSADLGLIPVVLAAAGHFITNIVFSVRTRLARQVRIDRAWSSAHQESSPEALVEVFEEEKSGGEFTLPVRLDAEVTAGTAQRAPWSQSTCVGWGIEVDLYKSTILGGDADYTPLEQANAFDAFQVRSGGQTVQVQPPGIVRGASAKEELLGWSLLDEHHELRKIVENAMQLQKLARPKFSGIRVRESSFGKGDVVTVWGTAAKGKTSVEIGGSRTPGAPDELLVSPPGRRVPSRHRVRFAIRALVNTLLAAGSLLLAGVLLQNASWWHLEQSYPWLNVDRVGPLHWNGDGSSAEVACRTLNLTGDGVLLRRTGESAKRNLFITLGGNPAAAWAEKDRQWVLTVDTRALSPRSAALHARNPNDCAVRMKVYEAGSDTPRATWTLPAGFGGADGAVLESGSAPFVFREGDSVLIEPLATDTLYDGPLSSCPTATWKDGLWTLRPPRAR